MPEASKIIHLVGIIIWQGKAYLPTQAQFESGIYVDIDPVYISEITVADLKKAIHTVKAAGITQLPDPKTHEEFTKRNDPILASTGARSWKNLAKTGKSYNIEWNDNEIRIDMSCLDKKGRWVFDPKKVQLLPQNTPIETIIQVILQDIQLEPESCS
jgi:hypothetical protein